jgi:glutathione synthase/RimK-type ligase-like ATP-grasp enzyme
VAVSRAVVLPYKMGSQSAKLLAQGLTQRLSLKVRRVRHDGRYRPKRRSLIVNYGSGSSPVWLGNTVVLNSPRACAVSGNKLSAFNAFKAAGLSIPEFTTDRTVAESWIAAGGMVVARTVLNGHSGRGIVVCSSDKPLVNAPLYVRYKKKRKEFRVHVFQGQVIDVAEKRKRRVEGDRGADVGLVRNLANGWVYCRDSVVCPADCHDLAVSACMALSLDFGAVDIIWNEKENKSYLLEVNTAPGLTGTTLVNYTNAIYNWLRSQV